MADVTPGPTRWALWRRNFSWSPVRIGVLEQLAERLAAAPKFAKSPALRHSLGGSASTSAGDGAPSFTSVIWFRESLGCGPRTSLSVPIQNHANAYWT